MLRTILLIPLLFTPTVKDIPTELERPNPVCGACSASTETLVQNGTTTGAITTFTYVADEGTAPYVGELVVEACFSDSTCEEVHRSTVTVQHQSTLNIVLNNGSSWGWEDDVASVIQTPVALQ